VALPLNTRSETPFHAVLGPLFFPPRPPTTFLINCYGVLGATLALPHGTPTFSGMADARPVVSYFFSLHATDPSCSHFFFLFGAGYEVRFDFHPSFHFWWAFCTFLG